jgi:hypothetical protein
VVSVPKLGPALPQPAITDYRRRHSSSTNSASGAVYKGLAFGTKVHGNFLSRATQNFGQFSGDILIGGPIRRLDQCLRRRDRQ